ncbi:G-protein coupled receptor 35-like [Cololabis saira]|uniref:G-protein coupled receptor 35-like n=1 Tax=Cololabis saira TaxID=129043 RepID=UPI002AD44900|nr:G-protein coupled receptor 35-like [Cololabis saira]
MDVCATNSNATNSSCKVEPHQGVSYASVFLVGFLLNAAALRAFIAKWDSWKDTHIYMFNLAIADFALILFLPFRVFDAFFCLPKNYFCTFLIFIHFINMYASIMTTTVISVQRYLSVRFPLKVRSWKKKKQSAVAVCLVIWVILVTVCAIWYRENSPQNLWTCFERCKDKPLKLSSMVLLVFVGYVTPLLIIVFCSTQIICILLKLQDKSEKMKNAVGMVTANMVVFIMCYTPIHIAFVVNYFYEAPQDWNATYLYSHNFLIWSKWIASTNCCFDSISYYFLLKRINS